MSNSDLSFVRTEMLDEKAPPSTQVGAVKWIRENLFSNAINSILTLLAIFVLYKVIVTLTPWIFGGVWNAGSLTECREALAAVGKTGHQAACWAVIEDRWHQLAFGFYPRHMYWRPILAVTLFAVALAPVLFSDRVPAKMMIFTLLYPFLAVWLLWGGSFWTPILVLAGFGAGYVGFHVAAKYGGALLGSIIAVLAAVIWWLFMSSAIDSSLHRMVANGRLDSETIRLETRLAELPAEIEAAEAVRDEKQAEIAAMVADKDALVDQIEAARGDDHHAVASDEHQAALSTFLADLAVLRDEESALSRVVLNLNSERSDSRALNNNILALDEREARLPEAKALVSELASTLPSSVQGLRSLGQIESGTSPEDEAALRAYLAAKGDLLTVQTAIDTTYTELGRVGLEPVASDKIGGFLLAIVIGVAGIVLSMPLGVVLALGRQSDLMIVNKSSVAFIEIIRGIPLIVWLFTASLLLNYFLPPGTQFDLMLRVIIMVTLFSAAYIAEVVRGGLAALPTGQYEAADALGLDYWKSMRLIILPQALKISIPGIVSSFIGLFKDTTLVVFIGLSDPIDFSNKIRADTAWNGIYWELFIFIGACFFIFCFGMSRYSQWLERKLHTGHR